MKDDEDLRGTNTGLRLIDLVTIVVVAAILGAAVIVWQAGPPGPMPMHFTASGRVDRWGDRTEMASVIAFLALLAGGVSVFCVAMEKQSRDPAAERFTYRLGRIIVLAVSALVSALLTAIAFGRLPATGDEGPFLRLMMGGLSVIFLGMGAFLGRAKPNPVVGVRTYWALRSRLAWDKSNRLAGRLFAIIGVLGLLATPIAPLPYGFHALTIAILVASLAAAFESWRVWRTDPDRA
ncbi:DUF1648 domain-containing protein [Caulobacter segnis]|uniref:Uncharacterized protein n=2 Tax=Caulobacter segnis TaxID=88688 RepID=D5VE24_CAUST|nr:SdpI family protein [Caulobacter segnis]ADG08724.1 conserved hypothetical protein [Caulobacter segnis ATCC 21756]AVQ00574.1 DUF1648 domain-containing protein [Caulobacter segnis]